MIQPNPLSRALSGTGTKRLPDIPTPPIGDDWHDSEARPATKILKFVSKAYSFYLLPNVPPFSTDFLHLRCIDV
jgi:hypothetical protein